MLQYLGWERLIEENCIAMYLRSRNFEIIVYICAKINIFTKTSFKVDATKAVITIVATSFKTLGSSKFYLSKYFMCFCESKGKKDTI